jgi:hypothetical protein
MLYLGFVASTLLMLRKVRKGSHTEDGLYYRAFGVQIGLIATLTASTFSDRLYGESFYWMCGLAAALYRMQQSEAQAAAPAAPQTVAPRRRSVAP